MEVSKFRAVDTVFERDSGELGWDEGWGPTERAKWGTSGGELVPLTTPMATKPPCAIDEGRRDSE